MKGFLIKHGEKIFLALVAVFAAWSLFSSLGSLGTTEQISEGDRNAIDKIAREFKTKRAQPKVAPPYAEWLQSNLDGHGIYASAVASVASPVVYEPPFEADIVKRVVKTVAGTIGVPTGLSATSDRGKVMFNWTASAAQHMSIRRYEVFRREENGPWSATPVYTGGSTSFEDRNVKPETEYAYKVRAVGVEAPEDPETMRVKPMSPPLAKQAGVWLTAFAGEVKTMTPSNIDFECSNVFDRWGQDYANIVIKRWNSKQDKWDEFKTTPGIQVGNRVEGTRNLDIFGTKKEKFDSGHILRKVVDELRDFEVWVEEYVEDPPGSGIVVKKKVKKIIQKRVQEIVLEKEDGSQKITVPVGKGKTTIERRAEEERPRDAPPSGLDEFKDLFNKSGGGAPAKEETPAAAEPSGAVAPKAPALTLAHARTAIRLTFPDGWAATGDIAGDLGVGAAWQPLLDDGKAAVYRGTVAKSGVVVADRPIGDEEKQKLIGSPGRKLDDYAEAKALASGMRDMTQFFFSSASESFSESSVVQREIKTRKTGAGKVVGSFVFKVAEGQGTSVVTRYCAAPQGRLYMLSFVCLEKDLESQSKVFDTIVSSWTW